MRISRDDEVEANHGKRPFSVFVGIEAVSKAESSSKTGSIMMVCGAKGNNLFLFIAAQFLSGAFDKKWS